MLNQLISPIQRVLTEWFVPTCESEPLLNYKTDHSSYPDRSQQAIVLHAVLPGREGRVRFEATEWYARCKRNVIIPEGAIVTVVGRENITLVIEPLPIYPTLSSAPSPAYSGLTL